MDAFSSSSTTATTVAGAGAGAVLVLTGALSMKIIIKIINHLPL
tara:strand:+ start:55 stop:186 length:132 start_codon:yes stop_codon:yes gene_type:complete